MSSRQRNIFLFASLLLLLLLQLLSACMGFDGVDDLIDGDQLGSFDSFTPFSFPFLFLILPVFGLSFFKLLSVYTGGRSHLRRFQDLNPDSDSLIDHFLFCMAALLCVKPLLFCPSCCFHR